MTLPRYRFGALSKSERPLTPVLSPKGEGQDIRRAGYALLAVLFLQLILGATVRHSGSGLAIPDFPASYGHIVPPLNQPALDDAMAALPYDEYPHTFAVWQVALHYSHRLGAIAVVAAAAWLIVKCSIAFPADEKIRRPTMALAVLLVAQVAMGASVIWSHRHHDVATAHQAIGAATLATATLLAVRAHRLARAGRAREAPAVRPIGLPNLEGAKA